MVLAHRASYAKKTLARQVIPLALGYRTALSSRPGCITVACEPFGWQTKLFQFTGFSVQIGVATSSNSY